ncbi:MULTISPECIES: hypothetical protein [Sphingobacterium]|jgi:hypothetical protein|uniref:hypothetical protein n=1 Tax=Sphingobacterium TaxID=28453 RepID=UPI0010FD7F7B|nr:MULTISPECIES: hypothetical protein [Sphingobacterium]MCT1530886.1 hypothetical protein [Sphingobacterium daejeonense]
MEIPNNTLEGQDLKNRLQEVATSCFTSTNNLENLSEEQQLQIINLFDRIKYKDIIDQGFWSLGGGLNHYKLSLNEIKLTVLEILSSRSDDKERLILKEIFLFLNILDEPSFYQLFALRQLLHCPEEIFNEKVKEVQGNYFA